MPNTASIPAIVFLVGAVQFVNVLDFMMVMPLGPDFAVALGIPNSQLGYIGGAYTAAAAVSGVLGSYFLDRFDRRVALGVAMLILVLGTVAGGFAFGMASLLMTRVVAGFAGGPATSLSYSIIADVVPPERRGKAVGAVMGAFSVASVLGVPAGLELARTFGWRAPFFAVGGLGLLVVFGAFWLLPPMRGHLAAESRPLENAGRSLLRNRLVLTSYAMTALVMLPAFMVIPNLSAYLQFNLGYPRKSLGLLYMVGGALSFFSMRIAGALVDRYGSFRVGSFGSLLFLSILWAGFVRPETKLPILLIFVGFMLCGSFRNVPYNALTTRVPGPSERARFMSFQSAIQHLASAAGAGLAAEMLHELPDKSLDGMPTVALLASLFAAILPLLLWMVERGVRARDRKPVVA